jgi:hypothetical protein
MAASGCEFAVNASRPAGRSIGELEARSESTYSRLFGVAGRRLCACTRRPTFERGYPSDLRRKPTRSCSFHRARADNPRVAGGSAWITHGRHVMTRRLERRHRETWVFRADSCSMQSQAARLPWVIHTDANGGLPELTNRPRGDRGGVGFRRSLHATLRLGSACLCRSPASLRGYPSDVLRRPALLRRSTTGSPARSAGTVGSNGPQQRGCGRSSAAQAKDSILDGASTKYAPCSERSSFRTPSRPTNHLMFLCYYYYL